jgi:uncharacterized protein YvpB
MGLISRPSRRCVHRLLLFCVFSLIIPAGVSRPASAAPVALPSKAIIARFPSVREVYNLSCEYAASSAITQFYGRRVTQGTFVREVPHAENPHLGFRGAIDAKWGGITNYGIYAEPLVPVLERHGYAADVYYASPTRHKTEIAGGHPVVVWMTGAARPGARTYKLDSTNTLYYLVPYEHAVVVYGYDSERVYTMDVGDGKFWSYGWAKFMRTWDLFNDMALAIHPAQQ